MRVAIIVVSILAVSTPAKASKSCMSQTEARQHFGSVHLYWHGPDHCWDATRWQLHRVQRKIDQPKWRDAMSAMSPNGIPTMLPDEEPVRAALVDRRAEVEPSLIDTRWVDIVQVPSPIIERKPEPTVMPRGVLLVLAFIAFAMTLALVEVLFRETPNDRPPRSAG
jgi:hypothetical protein